VRRKLTRRDFLRITGGGVTGAALLGSYGCGGAGGGGQGAGPVTLTWWDYFTEGAMDVAVRELLNRYEKTHPDVTINRRSIPFDQLKSQLQRAAGAGELPDIAIIDNPDHQSFAALGILMDISDQVDEWGEANAYFDAPWQSCQYQGKTYGIPNNSNCLTLFYNKDILRQQGVQPPTTWDELRKAAKNLTTGDHLGLAVSAIQSEEGTFQWLPFLWQAGGDIPDLNSEAGRAALGLWVELVRNRWMSKGILNWDQSDVMAEFANRRAAMMVNGPWQIPVINADYPDLNWDVVKLPKGEQEASILGGENNSIIQQSQYIDAAWDLLAWSQQRDILVSFLKRGGRLPSREDLTDVPAWADDPIVSVFLDQLLVAKPRAYGPRYPEISSYIQEAIQGAISGASDVETALANAEEQIKPLMEESQG
jgi:multiple sugar transport system substrate-binding protein